jgi:hypothetical protein
MSVAHMLGALLIVLALAGPLFDRTSYKETKRLLFKRR